MADYPVPIPGLVIRYAYLWKREADRGQIEGQKHRPCVVVLCVEEVDGEKIVTVAPITHSPPPNPEQAIAMTPATRRRLGLDEEKNWIMATEVNSFYWPGPDLTPTPTGEYAYGELPAVVFEALIKKIVAAGSKLAEVPRTE
ncbi:MAG: hypothetical protein P4L83_13285 [Nevskia sp.]|nr:hypothetical protein [Nevskia sp.]